MNKTFLVAMLVLGMGALATLTSAPLASAQQTDPTADSLIISVESTHTVKPEDGVIDVVEVYTYRNVRGSTRSGNIITSYFWTGANINTPPNAENIEVSSNGRVLELEDVRRYGSWLGGVAQFPSNLRFGQTRIIEVRYTVPVGRFVERLNATTLDMNAAVCCQFENATLRVVFPADFDIESLNNVVYTEDFERTVDGDEQIFSLSRTEVDDGFTEILSGSFNGVNRLTIVTKELAIGEGTITLQSGVADPQWQARAEALITTVAATATDITGIEWSGDLTFEHGDLNRKAFLEPVELEPPLEGTVRLKESFSEIPLSREIVRPLVPENPFDEAFLTRGLVDAIAADGMFRVKGRTIDPSPPFPGRVRTEGQQWFVRQVTDAIGWSGMMQLIELGETNEVAFLGTDEPESAADVPDDWRRILDLGERRLEMAELRDIAGEFLVSSDEDQAVFTERNALVDRHDDLVERAGTTLPLGVRAALSTWDFDTADELLDASEDVLDAADAHALVAAGGGVTVDIGPPDWDKAAGKAALVAMATRYERSDYLVGHVVDRRADIDLNRGFIGSRGFDKEDAGATLTDAENALRVGDNATAEAALADYDRLAADADSAGLRSLAPFAVLAGAVLVVLVIGLVLWRRSRRSRTAV